MTKKKPTIDEILNIVKEKISSCNIAGCVEGYAGDLITRKSARFNGKKRDIATSRPVDLYIICRCLVNKPEDSFSLVISENYYENHEDTMQNREDHYTLKNKDEYNKVIDLINKANNRLFYEIDRYKTLNVQMHQIIQLSREKIRIFIKRNEGKESLVLTTTAYKPRILSTRTIIDFDHYVHLDYLVQYILEYVMNTASISESDIFYIVHRFLAEKESYQYREGVYLTDISRLWEGEARHSKFGFKEE